MSTTGNVKHVNDEVQKSNVFKICVLNILRVLEYKLKDVNATA